ncbi:MAG: hypothetical protein ACE5RP_00190 [Nitrosopumilus sp.]
MTEGNIFDKFVASGREALRPGKLIARAVLILLASFILGIERIAINLETYVWWKAILKTMWQGVGRALDGFWQVFRILFTINKHDVTGGTWFLFGFFVLFLLFVFFPIVRTFLDLIDFKAGEALGTLAYLGITVALVIVLSFLVNAGISEEDHVDMRIDTNKTQADAFKTMSEDELMNTIDLLNGG